MTPIHEVRERLEEEAFRDELRRRFTGEDETVMLVGREGYYAPKQPTPSLWSCIWRALTTPKTGERDG
jgi:hypothetical protein